MLRRWSRRGAARFVGIVVMYSVFVKLWVNELEKKENEMVMWCLVGEVKVYFFGGFVEFVNVDFVLGDEDERGEISVGDANFRGVVEFLGVDVEILMVECFFVVDGVLFFVCGCGGVVIVVNYGYFDDV